VQVVPEAEDGTPDIGALDAALVKHAHAPLLLGSFSAASNVTGIAPDVRRLSRVLARHGALAAVDFASAATYCHGAAEAEAGMGSSAADAIMLPPNKFAGGPGSCGVLVVRKSILRNALEQVSSA
jgi:selenocysteine lyase/cysteine desulfurase